MGISWEYYRNAAGNTGNAMGTLWEHYGKTIGILREYCINTMGILNEYN